LSPVKEISGLPGYIIRDEETSLRRGARPKIKFKRKVKFKSMSKIKIMRT